MASRFEAREIVAGAGNAAVALGLGALGAFIAAVCSVYGLLYALAASAAIPMLVLVVLRPRVGIVLFMFALVALEEFPGGLSEQMVERSERMPFYALTFGLPATYPPDAIILGVLGLYLLRKLLTQKGYGMRLDLIGGALLLIATSMTVSVLLGLAENEPLGPEVLDLSLLGAIKLPETAARYIAVLQLKIFVLLFVVYLLGLIYFRSERDLREMVIAVGAGLIATIALGAWRLYGDPTMVKQLIAVIYDTASVTFMALGAFYVIAKWACNQYNARETLVRAFYAMALMLLIVLSFRRTLWGGVALCTVVLPFIMPREGRARLLALMAIGVMVVGAVLVSLPGGQDLLLPVLERAEQTTSNDPSTLYRFSLLVWVVDRFTELPYFGWGIKPLWNETIHIRFFTSNMENVHSLYFWVLTRFGIVGIFAFGIGLVMILVRMVRVGQRLSRPEHKILLALVFLTIVLYLFGGIFNPVYASIRLVVPLGFALALVTRLPEIAAAAEARTG